MHPYILLHSGHRMYAKVTCLDCEREFHIPVTQTQIDLWKAGEFIQNVFPELSNIERELLISGTCPQCWRDLFPPNSMLD